MTFYNDTTSSLDKCLELMNSKRVLSLAEQLELVGFIRKLNIPKVPPQDTNFDGYHFPQSNKMKQIIVELNIKELQT